MTTNSKLYDSSGNWLAPSSSTYKVNYQAILKWLTTSPCPFPSQLHAGYICYYSAFPSVTDSTLNSRWWTTYPLTNTNERFWKDYIDYVLGNLQIGTSSYKVILPMTGYGDDFSGFGTAKIGTASGGCYINYTDNPQRPLLHFWFGPLTMVDFLGNYSLLGSISPYASHNCWLPGTAHEAPLFACKLLPFTFDLALILTVH